MKEKKFYENRNICGVFERVTIGSKMKHKTTRTNNSWLLKDIYTGEMFLVNKRTIIGYNFTENMLKKKYMEAMSNGVQGTDKKETVRGN